MRQSRFGTVPGRGLVIARGEVSSPSGARLGRRPIQVPEATNPAAADCTLRPRGSAAEPSWAGGRPALGGVATVIWGTTDPPRRRWPKGCAKISDNFANDSGGRQGEGRLSRKTRRPAHTIFSCKSRALRASAFILRASRFISKSPGALGPQESKIYVVVDTLWIASSRFPEVWSPKVLEI